jgi:hypothetical protein
VRRGGRQPSRRQNVALGDSHAVRLAIKELDAACRAARVPATGMQLIDCRILLKSQDQPLTLRHFVLAYALDCELRHDCVPSDFRKSFRIIPRSSKDGKQSGITRELAGYG